MEHKTSQPLSPERIILILIVIAVAVECLTLISNRVISPVNNAYQYDYDINEYFPEADASLRGGITYLSDDDVKKQGLACTELEHFDFPAQSLLDELYDIFREEGLSVNSVDTSSYNQIYGDGGSWYETLMTFYLEVPGDQTDYQRLTLNYDTATEDLHEIDIFLSDKERIQSLTSDILSMLDERTHTFPDGSLSEAESALERSLGRGENLYAAYGEQPEEGYLSLTLYCYEDGYSIYITREH